MSDSAVNRKSEDGSGRARATTDSQLRLITEDGADLFSEEPEPTDDTPTMISKQAPASTSPMPGNSVAASGAAAAAPTTTAIKPATSETLMQSLRGRILAHFELIEPIGVGGMAAVLRARDTQLDRYVALKILPPDMAADEESVSRFHQEARSAAKLDHENIARVFYCGEDQNLHFIAFEFVEGENLRSILERRGKLPVAEAVRYVLQVATGLEHAASRGVVHRDIKPSNIIITPTGRAKLVDMGLARSVGPQRDQLTQSGVTLGTFDYISPEQALEPREADARSDVYSLGCTFYHMLTGRPPVPEGTAAKKLHHHQHVMPIDPRQLNPAVPDEIALILGKMMAKNARDRYQRPLHLVQHLMQVAQKVGVADDLPEGVLFVDAPLPTEPRKRPLLLVSLGALGLAALLMVLSLAPPRPNQAPRSSKDNGERPPHKDTVAAAAVKQLPATATASQQSNEVATEEELLKYISQAPLGQIVRVKVTAGIRLSPASLVLTGPRTLHIEGLDNAAITVTHQASEHTEALAAPVVIDGAEVVFKNIDFRIDAQKSEPMFPAVVAVRGKSQVRFHQCSFQQDNVLPPPYIANRGVMTPLASVLVQQGEGEADVPQVVFDGCFFRMGQTAVAVEGTAVVDANNCAFKPHGAFFHVRGSGAPRFNLTRCSGFVLLGPAFRVDDDPSVFMTIRSSIFSRPETQVSDRDVQSLIHFTSATQPRLKFEGSNNCYDNLILWSWKSPTGADRIVNSLDEFQREIAPAGGSDSKSVALTDPTKSIWENAHPHMLPPDRGFRVRTDVAAVRALPDLTEALGVQSCTWGDMPPLPPLKQDPFAARLNLGPGEKLVDPTTDGNTRNVFATVHQALAAANPRDVILLKPGPGSRELQVTPTALDTRENVDIKLKPYQDYQPILMLDKTIDPNAAFFRLYDGAITLEQLEVVLDPDQDFLSQSLVQLNGNGSVTFRNCVLTLRQNAKVNPSRSVPLTVVSLGEADEVMKMMGTRPARSVADVVFQNCFIRGEGEVIGNRAGRAMSIQADNTLVGLTGSFVDVQGAAKEAPPDSAIVLRLNRSSFFLTEPFLSARVGKHAKGLPPIRVEQASGCLFVPLEPKPFIDLPLPDLSDATLRTVFDWKGASNAYRSYEWLLDDGQFLYQLSPLRWKEMFYKDSEPLFTAAAFQLATPPRQLWLTVPDAYKPRTEYQAELAPYGVPLDLDQLPAMTKKTEP